MAEKVTIARPYAKAAFAYAQKENALAHWSDLLAAASTVVKDARVAPLVTSPRVTPEQLSELISDASGVGAKDLQRNFIGTLAENRRLGLLPEIAAMYETLRAEAENIADVQVTSAVPLDEAQRQRLATALKKRLNKRDVRLHCDVDASLVGGAVVRAGDMVIDGSLKGRLERLAIDLAQ
jgi:F-type H+-transporting ATPase subunit delta